MLSLYEQYKSPLENVYSKINNALQCILEMSLNITVVGVEGVSIPSDNALV